MFYVGWPSCREDAVKAFLFSLPKDEAAKKSVVKILVNYFFVFLSFY